jgi:hypothetical protein
MGYGDLESEHISKSKQSPLDHVALSAFLIFDRNDLKAVLLSFSQMSLLLLK